MLSHWPWWSLMGVPVLRDGRVLLLYGGRDALVPRAATELLIRGIETSGRAELVTVRYRDGHHMLLRDRQADLVTGDILHRVTGRVPVPPPGSQRKVWVSGRRIHRLAASRHAARRP